MHRILRYGVAALLLIATPALAQTGGDAETGRINRGAGEAQMPPQGSPPVNVQPVAPAGGAATGQGQPAPASSANNDNTGAASSGPIGATQQTMPAKNSPRNAAIDQTPIMAHPLPLSEEEKSRIYEAVSKKDEAVVRALEARPATTLPPDVQLYDLPEDITKEIPAVRGYKYVRLPEKVLLVSPPNRIVVGEIAR